MSTTAAFSACSRTSRRLSELFCWVISSAKTNRLERKTLQTVQTPGCRKKHLSPQRHEPYSDPGFRRVYRPCGAYRRPSAPSALELRPGPARGEGCKCANFERRE